MRGFCLLVLIVDHLQFFPSAYDLVAGRGLYWVSAAEGFFFISGLLIGMVRYRDLLRSGLRTIVGKSWRRAGTLYIASIILTLVYTAIGQLAEANNLNGAKVGLATGMSWLEIVWRTITLRYSYGWTDFLNYYVAYLLLAPGVLWLLRRRADLVVLAASIALWLSHFWWDHPPLDDLVSWQVYFFTGMVIGVRWKELKQWVGSVPRPRLRLAKRVIVISTLVTMVINAIYNNGPGWLGNTSGIAHWILQQTNSSLYYVLFEDNRHALLRYPIFLLWWLAFYLVCRRYEGWVMAKLGWLLMPLGTNSLYVYIISGVLAYLVHFIKWPQGFVVGTILATIGILLIWYPTKKGWLFGVIPR